MEKQVLDIRVYVEDDYVYMSVKDWLKIAKFLGTISNSWSVSEIRKGDPEGFTGGNVH
jgi:hypothetical protein